jgi:hypothetical protein
VRRSFWTAIVLVALSGPMGNVRADDLEGSLTMAGNVVVVRVFNEKGIPATDIPLRLRDSDKKIVAVGRTDAAGAWSYPLDRGGKFEVEVICGPADDDLLHMPFSLKGPTIAEPAPIMLTLPCCRAESAETPAAPPPDDFPIETAALGLGCLGGAGALLLLRRLGTLA